MQHGRRKSRILEVYFLMNMDQLISGRGSRAAAMASLVLGFLMTLIMVQSLAAQELVAAPTNLSGSLKEVDQDQAQAGDSLHYTVWISNSGGTPATSVMMTDVLPAEVTYQEGSLSVVGGGLYGVRNGVITWTGAVNNESQIQVSFDAVLTDTLAPGQWVTNTAEITGTGSLLLRSASTEIVLVTGTTAYFPLMLEYPDPPVLNPVSSPNSNNQWTVSWSYGGGAVTRYELQESRSPDFSAPTTFDMGTLTSKQFSHAPSNSDNSYYYRVRVIGREFASVWSQTHGVVGSYYDAMDGGSGWAIRRQDTDDVNNSSWYESGSFVLRIGGRWDYAIAAPMIKAPRVPYKISTRAYLWEPDNLNSYGIIFGGDWNGQPCPAADYSTCFNHYYRLNIVWHGDAARDFMMELKRIDYHDPVNNAGKGVALIPFQSVYASDPGGWNQWDVVVDDSGLIQVFLNSDLVGETTDTTYIHDRYFGVFASSDEYLGARPFFDYYGVASMD